MIQAAGGKRTATFRLSHQDLATLRALAEEHDLTQATVLQIALRDLAGRLERGEPVHVGKPKNTTRGHPDTAR